MAARLKVFTWSDGFHRYTMAATSRAKALAAWGFHRDLFKTGDAQEIVAGDDYDRALAAPGVCVERGLSIDVGKVEVRNGRPIKAPSARDRARVTQLEADLAALDREYEQAQTDRASRRQALDAEAATRRADFDRRRTGLSAKLDKARKKLGA